MMMYCVIALGSTIKVLFLMLLCKAFWPSKAHFSPSTAAIKDPYKDTAYSKTCGQRNLQAPQQQLQNRDFEDADTFI